MRRCTLPVTVLSVLAAGAARRHDEKAAGRLVGPGQRPAGGSRPSVNAFTLSPNQVITTDAERSVSDQSPQLAMALVNTLMSDFVADVSRTNQDRAAQAVAALTGQIATLGEALRAEQADLAVQGAQHRDTAALEAQVRANLALLGQLTVENGTLRSQLTQDLTA